MTKEVELAYWINERYQMMLRKERWTDFQSWQYGWSNDPIMGTTRWCNVHREDDAVTRWLAKHWRPKHHAVWEIVLARMVNYLPSLSYVLKSMENQHTLNPLAEAKDALKRMREQGEKVFTSAYTISTCGKRMDKIDYVIDHVVAAVQKEEPNLQPFYIGGVVSTLEDYFWRLRAVDGLGSFLAGQVIADLKNTPGHPLKRAPDWWTWACPGPGSLRGLEAFYGARTSPSMFAQDLAHVAHVTQPLLDKKIPRISMQDWQNCMCEFSKYMKLKEGRGHARNRYTP